jgi:hypothetical protein
VGKIADETLIYAQNLQAILPTRQGGTAWALRLRVPAMTCLL